MTWNCIRKATSDDIAAVRDAAERFCKRHGLEQTAAIVGAISAVDAAINPGTHASALAMQQAARLRKLWRATMKRITGSPDGIAYGHVGRPA